MKPHALLINPWIHDFAAYDFWHKPLGLLEIASYLRRGGYEVSLIDCMDVHYRGRKKPLPKRQQNGSGKFDAERIEKPEPLLAIPRTFKRYGMPAPSFLEAVKGAPPPDVVLVCSVMTYWYTGVAEAIAGVKGIFPEAPVILGGVYATLLPEHAQKSTGADLIAPGDYRDTLRKILGDLGLPADLPAGPVFPAWDLYPTLGSAAILTGRGCDHRCAYCAVHVLAKKVEQRDPVGVVEEIERLSTDHSVRDIAFFDDALRAGGDEHLKTILEGIIREKIAVRLHAINGIHLKGLDGETARLLQGAQVMTLHFGLESTQSKAGETLHTKANLDDLVRAIQHLKRAGYDRSEIGVYLLAGLPGQRPEEVERSINDVTSAGARPYLNEYSPVPKSPLWERAIRSARFDIEAEPLYQNNTLLACAHPEMDSMALSRLKVFSRQKFMTG
jgi:radical SAM superfamily enzyme YgiQ (UPF0313 family)